MAGTAFSCDDVSLLVAENSNNKLRFMKKLNNGLLPVLATTLVLFCTGSIQAQRPDSSNRNTNRASNRNNSMQGGNITDTAFIEKNIRDNRHEIQMARMALNKGTSQPVKDLAQQLVTDHSQMLRDLRQAARANNMSGYDEADSTMMMDTAEVGSGGNSMARGNDPAKHTTDHRKELESATGYEFDRMWVSRMLAMHQQKLNELTTASRTLKNQELKMTVDKAIPVIRRHRDTLSNLNKQSNNSNNNNNNRMDSTRRRSGDNRNRQ
jgi:putative membrane protein